MIIWAFIAFIIMLGATIGFIILSRKEEDESIDAIEITSRLDEHRQPIEVSSQVCGRVMATRIGNEWWSYFWIPPLSDVSYGLDNELRRLSNRVNEILPGGFVFQTANIALSTMPGTVPSKGRLCRIKIPHPRQAERALYSVIYALQQIEERKSGSKAFLPLVYPLFIWTEHLPIEATTEAPAWGVIEQIEEDKHSPTTVSPEGKESPYPIEDERGG